MFLFAPVNFFWYSTHFICYFWAFLVCKRTSNTVTEYSTRWRWSLSGRSRSRSLQAERQIKHICGSSEDFQETIRIDLLSG